MTIGEKARTALQHIHDETPQGVSLLFQLLMRGYSYDVTMRELHKLSLLP